MSIKKDIKMPAFKDGTHNRCLEHINLLKNLNPENLLFGDSMLERITTTSCVSSLFDIKTFIAGVGGDPKASLPDRRCA